MADLDPAHVEAVADLVGEWLFRMHGIQSSCDHHAEATELLTSTDPAVHAALLAALVRAGVLEEKRAPIARHAGVHHWQQRWDGHHTHEGRRYVTRWEDVDA